MNEGGGRLWALAFLSQSKGEIANRALSTMPFEGQNTVAPILTRSHRYQSSDPDFKLYPAQMKLVGF